MRGPDEPTHVPAGRDGLLPPPAFRIEEGPAPQGVTVLVLAGEIDLATSGRFREFVERARAERVHAVVADLADVTFMDSTMLRELLRTHRELAAEDARFILAGAQPSVRRLLDLTGTTELFTLVDSRAEALASVG